MPSIADVFFSLCSYRNPDVGVEYNMSSSLKRGKFLGDFSEEEKKFSFQLSLAFVHVTFDNTEIKEGSAEATMGRGCAGIFVYFLQVFLSINIIIFVHTFVKMTRYLHATTRCVRGLFHYVQWLVSNNNILPTVSSSSSWHTAEHVSLPSEDKKCTNSVRREAEATSNDCEQAWTRNSKLIVKAHKTLILLARFANLSPVGLLEKRILNAQCYLLMVFRFFTFQFSTDAVKFGSLINDVMLKRFLKV